MIDIDEIISRIKDVRLSLKLSQDEFAESLNLKRNSITQIETSRRNPSERTILDICREFNVNENWLRTGEGEMFDELSDDEVMMALIGKLCSDGNEYKKLALRAAAKIIDNDTCWNIIEKELLNCIDTLKKE